MKNSHEKFPRIKDAYNALMKEVHAQPPSSSSSCSSRPTNQNGNHYASSSSSSSSSSTSLSSSSSSSSGTELEEGDIFDEICDIYRKKVGGSIDMVINLIHNWGARNGSSLLRNSPVTTYVVDDASQIGVVGFPLYSLLEFFLFIKLSCWSLDQWITVSHVSFCN